jgi:hypothetical protein
LADTDFSDEDLDFDDGFDSDDDGDDLDSAAGFDSPAGFDDESVLPLVAGVVEDADESESVLLGALFLA